MAIAQFRIVQTCNFWNPLFKVNGKSKGHLGPYIPSHIVGIKL
jgi:hypothetical protein